MAQLKISLQSCWWQQSLTRNWTPYTCIKCDKMSFMKYHIMISFSWINTNSYDSKIKTYTRLYIEKHPSHPCPPPFFPLALFCFLSILLLVFLLTNIVIYSHLFPLRKFSYQNMECYCTLTIVELSTVDILSFFLMFPVSRQIGLIFSTISVKLQSGLFPEF